MAKKIEITERQALQFNLMLAKLKLISKGYSTPAQIQKESKGAFGLDYEEALLMTCPTVTIDELNQCVGFDGAPFKTIGFAGNNDSLFGFVVRDDWGFIKPDDCEEVTNSKYNELFKP